VAIVYERKISKERVLQCDRCHKTRAMDLGLALKDISRSVNLWFFLDDERCLCPDCVRIILESWYNQQDVDNFHLVGSSENSPKRRKSKEVVA